MVEAWRYGAQGDAPLAIDCDAYRDHGGVRFDITFADGDQACAISGSTDLFADAASCE